MTEDELREDVARFAADLSARSGVEIDVDELFAAVMSRRGDQ